MVKTKESAITIVGGGLVGSLWATWLARRGFSVQVFERRTDPRRAGADAGRSINLIITSRGLHALEQVGLTDKALRLSVPVYGRMIHPIQGDLVFQAYGQEGECNYSISRSALNRFLLDEAEKAGAQISFDHSLQNLDAQQKILSFETPQGLRQVSYQQLFGTDGAGSQVRHQLAQKFPDIFRERTDWLEADYKELTLPRKANGEPALRTDALHIWPRGAHMMMALANQDGSMTVTLYLPKKGTPSFETVQGADAIRNLWQSEFPDAISLMPSFVEEFLQNPQGHLGTVRSSHWVWGDSIALMGDAAHAIVPFFGQGMNCGFEDCVALWQIFEANGRDWGKTLRAYEETRQPQANAIADMALENWIEMRDKVGDASFMLRKKVEGLLEKRHPQLYKSRYGMITYTLIPYAVAQQAGRVQDRLLTQICESARSPQEIDWNRADQLLQKEWLPFVQENHLNLSTSTTRSDLASTTRGPL